MREVLRFINKGKHRPPSQTWGCRGAPVRKHRSVLVDVTARPDGVDNYSFAATIHLVNNPHATDPEGVQAFQLTMQLLPLLRVSRKFLNSSENATPRLQSLSVQ